MKSISKISKIIKELNSALDQAKANTNAEFFTGENETLDENIELLGQGEGKWKSENFCGSKFYRCRRAKRLLLGAIKLGLIEFSLCAAAVSYNVLANNVGKSDERLYQALRGLDAKRIVSEDFRTFLKREVLPLLPKEVLPLLPKEDLPLLPEVDRSQLPSSKRQDKHRLDEDTEPPGYGTSGEDDGRDGQPAQTDRARDPFDSEPQHKRQRTVRNDVHGIDGDAGAADGVNHAHETLNSKLRDRPSDNRTPDPEASIRRPISSSSRPSCEEAHPERSDKAGTDPKAPPQTQYSPLEQIVQRPHTGDMAIRRFVHHEGSGSPPPAHLGATEPPGQSRQGGLTGQAHHHGDRHLVARSQDLADVLKTPYRQGPTYPPVEARPGTAEPAQHAPDGSEPSLVPSKLKGIQETEVLPTAREPIDNNDRGWSMTALTATPTRPGNIPAIRGIFNLRSEHAREALRIDHDKFHTFYISMCNDPIDVDGLSGPFITFAVSPESLCWIMADLVMRPVQQPADWGTNVKVPGETKTISEEGVLNALDYATSCYLSMPAKLDMSCITVWVDKRVDLEILRGYFKPMP